MRYIVLLVALAFTGCSPKHKVFICLTAMGGVQIDSSSPDYKGESWGYITIEAPTGDFFQIPTNLCVRVKNASGS